MVYEISLGVRRGEEEFLNRLEQALNRRRGDVQRILKEYGVPDASAQTALR
jgi:mxaJ protein